MKEGWREEEGRERILFLNTEGAMVLGVGLLGYWEEKDEKESDI